MTLADLNFTYDTSGIDSLKSKIAESLQISNYIEETPTIISEDLQKIVDYFSSNFNTNLENLVNDIKDYFDQQSINLKNDIEQSLALDPNTTYNIHVTEADHALDSDKLEGKTFNEVVSYIVSNYITSATVANALKFDGKTYSEVISDVQNVKVNNASNADKFNNMTYNDVKNDILSSIDLGEGTDLDLIKNKVENEWIAFKSKDTDAFGGDDKDTWLNNLIPSVKVNNAVDADKLSGYTFSDITTSVNSMIENQLNTYSTTDAFINTVKSIKVNNAIQADQATDSLQINGYSFNDLTDYIANKITINEALNAKNFDNLSKTDWETYIQNQVESLKNDLTNGNVVPAKAEEVSKINGIEVENFDDHIKEIVDEEYTDLTGEIDATYLNGYDFDNLMTYIQKNVKVDNAKNADFASAAAEAQNSSKLNNKFDYEIEDEAKELTLDYLDENPIKKVDIAFDTKEEFNYNFSLSSIFTYFNPTKLTVLPDVSTLLYGFEKQVISYDDNGNISEIKYFSSTDLLTFDDGSSPVDNQYVNQHEDYTYDDNGNITKIQKDLYLPIGHDNKPYSKVTFIQNFEYDDNGNVTTVTVDKPTITGIDTLLTS